MEIHYAFPLLTYVIIPARPSQCQPGQIRPARCFKSRQWKPTNPPHEDGGIEEPLIDTPFSGFWAFSVLINGYLGNIRSAF